MEVAGSLWLRFLLTGIKYKCINPYFRCAYLPVCSRRPSFNHKLRKPMHHALDETDLRILQLLQQDARQTDSRKDRQIGYPGF